MRILNHIHNVTRRATLALMVAGCFLGSTLQGCTDELKLTDESDPNSIEIEGDCLAFTMKLDRALSTRDGEDTGSINSAADERYDNYIDTQDKFRIFFFTEQGDFLFGATDRVVGNLGTGDYNADYWYVRIPMTMIVDRDNQEYDIDKIKSYLKNHKFKIAVLANWPNGGEKVNPADWDDSEGTPTGTENPSSTLKGHPKWNWSNSILNKDAHPDSIRNINDLHHVYNDLYYSDAASGRFASYRSFMEHVTSGNEPGYYMGEPTDWVKMRDVTQGWGNSYDLSIVVPDFDGKETANQWIRANWSPNVELNQNQAIYRHYAHMWFLWNFDATYKTGEKEGNVVYKLNGDQKATDQDGYYIVEKVNDATAYDDNWGWNDGNPNVTNKFGEEWYKRNGDRLYQWMKASYSNPNQAIGPITIDIGESNNDVIFSYVSKTGEPAKCVKIGENYGIQLPALGAGEKVDYSGMMTFRARTSGTLRIKWSSAGNTSSGLAVQVGLPNHSEINSDVVYYADAGYSSATPRNWTNSDGLEYMDITVSEGSKPVYIFGTSGKPVVYAIEFIRGRYLYNTDREGIMPSELQGIPMYGVEDFDKIDDWQRGTTHNLPGNINLIRALAKVEIYISKSFGEPKHVLMRGMNRAARCEPIDVHTPTSVLWGDDNMADHADRHPTYPNPSPTELNGDMCEWFRVQQYGVGYNKSNKNQTDYTNWLSWFYGSWQYKADDKYPINWPNRGDYEYNRDLGYFVHKSNQNKGWDGINDVSSELKPPHIFNPYIYRSDFVNFLKTGDSFVGEAHYNRYVLYVPEKNIDDPTVVGNLSSAPKVLHVEYRFVPEKKSVGSVEDIVGIANGGNGMATPIVDSFENSEYNLDDNDCFRIYFTNYGSNQTGSNGPVNTEFQDGSEWYSVRYDEYEQGKDLSNQSEREMAAKRLENHWPIMRNHIYKMYVGGSSPENPQVHVQVTDWGHRKVVVEW